jgi:hypothetical protein
MNNFEATGLDYAPLSRIHLVGLLIMTEKDFAYASFEILGLRLEQQEFLFSKS